MATEAVGQCLQGTSGEVGCRGDRDFRLRILITGAAGNIGREVVTELDPHHELRLVDRRGGDSRIVTIDLGQPLRGDTFRDVDAVIHLAANPDEHASWEAVLNDNIRATWHVLEAASEHAVPRVIFASSNWAVKALERELAPGCYRPDGPKIGSEAAPRPLHPYGISKALGEMAGRSFVDQGRLRSFVAVRIGAYAPEPPAHDDHPLWIGASDLRTLFRRCVDADFHGFHVVYGISAQPTGPYDLTHTRELLKWLPRQLPPSA
jgi:nucleoside-diphosphate-sugar epimerase